MNMAEFCVDCWNELNETNYPPEVYRLSKEFEVCEGCGEWKRTIIACRKHYVLRLLIKRILKC